MNRFVGLFWAFLIVFFWGGNAYGEYWHDVIGKKAGEIAWGDFDNVLGTKKVWRVIELKFNERGFK